MDNTLKMYQLKKKFIKSVPEKPIELTEQTFIVAQNEEKQTESFVEKQNELTEQQIFNVSAEYKVVE